jgi:O-antigen/teichoic acid export membrane protein
MSADMEGLLYFSVMVIVFLIGLAFSIIRIKKSGSLKKSISQFIIVSFILYSLACILWFYIASDGFGQVLGGLLYGIAFVLGGLLNTGIIFYLQKKN